MDSRDSVFRKGMQVSLTTPCDVDLHIVFRAVIEKAPPCNGVSGYVGKFVTRADEGLKLFTCLSRAWGLLEAVKAALKLATRRRNLYLFMEEQSGELASYGWVSIGFSSHYPVSERDIVIGPIWTLPSSRGHGLASAGLLLCQRAMFERGHTVFFIDTRESNAGCVTAAGRAGFLPVAAHWRLPGL